MITISPLSEQPHFLQTCIAWSDREWRALTGFTALDWDQEFRRVQADPVDEVFVAHHADTPLGMAWMVEREGLESHAHLTPWLSNLVIDPLYRGQGLARQLIDFVAKYVSLGGDTALHLLTDNPSLYVPMRWDVMDIARLGARNVYVMQHDLSYLEQPRRYGT